MKLLKVLCIVVLLANVGIYFYGKSVTTSITYQEYIQGLPYTSSFAEDYYVNQFPFYVSRNDIHTLQDLMDHCDYYALVTIQDKVMMKDSAIVFEAKVDKVFKGDLPDTIYLFENLETNFGTPTYFDFSIPYAITNQYYVFLKADTNRNHYYFTPSPQFGKILNHDQVNVIEVEDFNQSYKINDLKDVDCVKEYEEVYTQIKQEILNQ